VQLRCDQCVLRDCGAFKPVTPKELAIIDDLKKQHIELPAGAEIIRASDESPELFTLYSGWAFRFKTLPDGRRQILNFLLPGDLLGLQAAMFDAAQHGIEALTDVQLCVLPRQDVWALFAEVPALAFDVTWLGAREESIVDENLTSVGRRNAAERVAALIISLYKRAKSLTRPWRSFGAWACSKLGTARSHSPIHACWNGSGSTSTRKFHSAP
jgi:CRP-like cAMP-binding protein